MKMPGSRKRVKNIFGWALRILLIFLMGLVASVSYPIIDWVKDNFGITIQEIIYTVATPLKGANTDFLSGAFEIAWKDGMHFLVLFVSGLLLVTALLSKIDARVNVRLKRQHSFSMWKIGYLFILLYFGISCYQAYGYLDEVLMIGDYIKARSSRTTVYEDYYIYPNDEIIIAPKEKKNLIYVYVESMETTYASADEGGMQAVNYIPNLTRLAEENVSFSNGERLGGWRVTSGNTWTMGSLFSTTAGIPFSFPIEGNSMSERSSFASGVTSLGDVLEQQGYVQEFLCGSDGEFAGRSDYFLQHGNYKVFDYYTAIEEGYIPEDYWVFWGYEDKLLYQIAKDELTKLAKSDSPFNFTMLTVDTHHTGGYVCEMCENKYEEPLANVVTCADSQVFEFVAWCREQDFYDDTVIVICGDHPRMDTILVGELKPSERPVYNVFINSSEEIAEVNMKNREFTAMDMFPTVLSALGNEIVGDRLGLGTNLFADKQTLAEEMGMKVFEEELEKYSVFYVKTFE